MSGSGALPRVAVVGPLTGARTAWGQLLTDGIVAFAAARVRWETFDDQGDVALASQRASEIVTDGGFAAVIGHFSSLGAIRAMPAYRQAGLAVVLPLATNPDVAAGAEDLVVRLAPDDDAQAAAIATACESSPGCARIIVVHDGSQYGRGLAGRILAATGLPARVYDDWPAELASSAVVLAGVHHGVAAILRRRPGDAVLVFVTDDCDVAEFAELAGSAAAGVKVARLDGGPLRCVTAGFAGLAAVLGKSPRLRGAALAATVKACVPSTGWCIADVPQPASQVSTRN
jgi:hypothetical protein